jgi:predicted transposase/invertase (TIGR01784 family)
MSLYLDPKNDLTFKRVFGEHEHLCMSLLNSMLPLEGEREIVSLQYQPAELVPDIPGQKDSIVDVRCVDNLGNQFLVEMQMHWTESFKSRVLFNASKAYVKQLEMGKEYKYLRPVYALSFINDCFDPDPDVFYHDYKIVNVENTGKRIEGLEMVFIELPKFKPTGKAEKKLYDLWLTFLTKIKDGMYKVPEELLDEEITKEAVRYLERFFYSEDQLYTYERYWDSISTVRTIYLDAVDEGIAEGRAEGIAEGRAEGIAEGKAEGKAEGRAEGREEAMAEMVASCKRNGLPVEQICAITGLDRKKVEEICAGA